MNKQTLLGIIVVCVLILGLVLFFVLKGSSSSKNTTQSPSNIGIPAQPSPFASSFPSPFASSTPAASPSASSSPAASPSASFTPAASPSSTPSNLLDQIGAKFYLKNQGTGNFIGNSSLVGPFSNISQVFTVENIDNSGRLVLSPQLWLQSDSANLTSGPYNLSLSLSYQSGTEISSVTGPSGEFYVNISGLNGNNSNLPDNRLLASYQMQDVSQSYATRVPYSS